MEVSLRVRISHRDAHYGGNLAAGARVMELFGDLATEVTIRQDGDEGLLRAYESVEFLAPVRGGDYIEATARMVKVGNTSRVVDFEAWKVISMNGEAGESTADVLPQRVLVCRARGTTVVPKQQQRKAQGTATS